MTQFESEGSLYFNIAFEHPDDWKWELRDEHPDEMFFSNPQSIPDKVTSGSIFLIANKYDLHPDAYQTNIDISLLGAEEWPEVIFGATTLIADREIEIDGFPARWITVHQEPYFRSDLNELVETIVIDAGDRAYTIIAHIALEDVGTEFGKGFYHLIETLEINP